MWVNGRAQLVAGHAYKLSVLMPKTAEYAGSFDPLPYFIVDLPVVEERRYKVTASGAVRYWVPSPTGHGARGGKWARL
jgi:hypothetical protein